MTYDLIIIGGGASGLFAGASLPHTTNGLLIERSSSMGKKLLMSGSGQCNLTHSGSIKDFLDHYGTNGKSIRPILYSFNNEALLSFFEKNGIDTVTREDGKIFPKSMKAQDVLNCLSSLCKKNGLSFRLSTQVISLARKEDGTYCVTCDKEVYYSKKVIVASGGCSYPTTGSDGNLFPVLSSLGITIEPLRPALTPIFIENYPYSELSGTAFEHVKLQILQTDGKKISEKTGALLFTHKNLSGPVVLDSSRFASTGLLLQIQYLPFSGEKLLALLQKNQPANQKQLLSVLQELLPLPKRFLELICDRLSLSPNQKFSQLSGTDLKRLSGILTKDIHRISKLDSFDKAMVTAGGVSLLDISIKTMESKQFPGLHFAGEALDVDGDTGGYNLQFAFSSAYLAAQQI